MEQAPTHKAVNSAEQAVQNATEKMAKAAHETVDSLRQYGERAEETFREQFGEIGDRGREVIDRVSDYIDHHPTAALGIAAAVGFVLGALAGRSSNVEGS